MALLFIMYYLYSFIFISIFIFMFIIFIFTFIFVFIFIFMFIFIFVFIFIFMFIVIFISIFISLSGTFIRCQHGANSHFFRFFSTFGLMHQNVVPLVGGGGACVSKSVRKGRFRNVWVGGGG